MALVEEDPRLASDFDPQLVWKVRALVALERKERNLSAKRRKLHWKIIMSPMRGMEASEREISKERRECHRRIDELRDELASMGWMSEE